MIILTFFKVFKRIKSLLTQSTNGSMWKFPRKTLGTLVKGLPYTTLSHWVLNKRWTPSPDKFMIFKTFSKHFLKLLTEQIRIRSFIALQIKIGVHSDSQNFFKCKIGKMLFMDLPCKKSSGLIYETQLSTVNALEFCRSDMNRLCQWNQTELYVLSRVYLFANYIF